VREVARRAASLKPDVVLLTGDYVHSGVGHVQASLACLSPVFDLRVPTVAVLGNHDFYGAADVLRKEFVRYSIPLLENQRLFLDAATRSLLSAPTGPALCIAGLSDYTEDRINPARALAGVPDGMPRLVLSHNPDAAEDPALLQLAPRIDLMLSGHTHGGQVRLPLLGTPIVPSKHGAKYAGGLVQGPQFPVLVCRGIGMSIIPVRWNVPPEILELTLLRG
jgi:predicted MPP superfamily phosphohydrolase